ncbi:ferric reductase NAD binding domain-containing protein [Trametes elegans]|nr:ferric reductase NAD binding domain-containing protein [Trametes elegans]
MGLVWLRHPVLWHSSRVPSGFNYTAMTLEQRELINSRWHNWYTADWDYARTTVYFFCAGIFLFGLVNLVSRLRHADNAKRAGVVRSIPFYTEIVAALRALEAKQVYVPLVDYYSPPLGAVVVVFGMVVFFIVLTFAPHPYIFPNPAMGHSPPIATRTGWISIAILPFLIVFATKVNLIGMFTGVSHEKLQVYHRWTAWIMYITSLIHTFPFIVQEMRAGTMHKDWTTTSWYWTGVAALIPQTWLVFMSWGPIRNRYYETFKKLHYIASGIFVAALFVHCNFRLTSWDYFWAIAALYGVSWLARYGRTLFNGLCHDASLEMLPENMVKMSIPTHLKWRPGQHFFVRFLDLGIHVASSHPFTVATLPSRRAETKESGNLIEIYARVHGGITSRLATLCRDGSMRASRVLLDGPYGGVERNLGVYDRVLLLAGGSGVTFVVPLFLDILRRALEGKFTCRKVHLVWAVRTPDALVWFDDVLSAAVKGAPEGLSVSVSYYITDGNLTLDDVSSKSEKDALMDGTLTKYSGRPDLLYIVREFSNEEGTVGIATCGPDSFTLDVGNAVCERELAILRGTARCSEIYMHHESYRYVCWHCIESHV